MIVTGRFLKRCRSNVGWPSHANKAFTSRHLKIVHARSLHFKSTEFVQEHTSGVPLVDKIRRKVECIKHCSSTFDESNSVAFFFATSQSDDEIKSILNVLREHFTFVVGNDCAELSRNTVDKGGNIVGSNLNNDRVEAALMLGNFGAKCSISTFSSEEHGLPPECLQLFSDRLKIDKEAPENSLNMMFFSTPSYDMTTVLRPVNGMMPEASKIGSVGANRVFSGSNIFYKGFAGVSISGNVAMDVISTQPYAYSYHLENASIYNNNRFYINHNDKRRQQLPALRPHDRLLFSQLDGANGPAREYRLATEYDEEKGEIDFAKFEFSGDGLDDEDETPVVFLQENPVFMARNVCVTLQEYATNMLHDLPSISGMMMFSSYNGEYNTPHFELESWNTLIESSGKSSNADTSNINKPASLGCYGLHAGIGPSNEDGTAHIFDVSTNYAIFRELEGVDPLPSQRTFCDLTASSVSEFNNTYGATVYDAQMALLRRKADADAYSSQQNLLESISIDQASILKEKSKANASPSTFATLPDKEGMEALPVFKWGRSTFNLPGETQEFRCFEPRYRFLVAYCVANNTDFVMHFEDNDLCLRHKICEHVEIKGGDYKIKTKITGRCYLHGAPSYVPGLFGMTLSYCKDVNDWDVSSAVAEPKILDVSTRIRKLLVDTMLLGQMKEESLQQYVSHRDTMIQELEDAIDNALEKEGEVRRSGEIILEPELLVQHSSIFNDENEEVLANIQRFHYGYMEVLRKFGDPPFGEKKPSDDHAPGVFNDSEFLETFTFDLISALQQCMYIFCCYDDINPHLLMDSLMKQTKKWLQMKNGETRLLEIDAFITELEAILEGAFRSKMTNGKE